MNDDVLTIDCTTGQRTWSKLTADEVAERKDASDRQAERDAKEQARTARLEELRKKPGKLSATEQGEVVDLLLGRS